MACCVGNASVVLRRMGRSMVFGFTVMMAGFRDQTIHGCMMFS